MTEIEPRVAYHPGGMSIEFSAKNHVYMDSRGVRYLSGTSFLKLFFPKFDSRSVAESCANGTNPKYSGRDPQEIMKEWQDEGDRGRSEGANVHEYAQSKVDPFFTKKVEPISDRAAALFRQVYLVIHNEFKNLQFVGAEVIIFSPALGIAGTVDLIMFHPETKTLMVYDWKQNKRPLEANNPYSSAFEPIQHLSNCDMIKYSLQLNLYRHIIERERYFPEAETCDIVLIHVLQDGYAIFPVDSYDFEIKKMLRGFTL